ncbi:helix-turn-helix transcription factor, AraC type [Mycena sanguinolenta]|nr:helix-turn-helix transcription factor, AraC type [Mycena sanguinolenta]
MFFSKAAVLALSIAAANAAPQLDSIFNSITSDVVSVASVAGGGAESVASQVASGAKGVFETVTSVGGHAVTVVTSAGGEAITLASDGVGELTTFAGSAYIIATNDVGAAVSGNSAPQSMSRPSATLMVGLLTVLTSACVGAMITV